MAMPVEEPTNLLGLLKSRPEVLQHGMACISNYIERNITFIAKCYCFSNLLCGWDW